MIALLGGDGFVGRNVADLLKRNHLPYRIASRKKGIDLRDRDACEAFFRAAHPTYIINCAAHVGSLNYVTQQAGDVILDNSRMILSTYEAIAKVCPTAIVLNPVANCAYPAKAETFIEDNWWDGHLHRSVLAYGSTKRFLWSVAEAFSMQYAVKSIHLLVPNMYGPFDSADPNKAHALNALISKFVKAEKMRLERIEVWGTGIAIREWLYASDFGSILIEIVKSSGLSGLAEPINIAQNFGLSVKELVEIIQLHFSYQGQICWDDSKPEGASKKVMDDRKFRKVFPHFRFTDLDEGIEHTKRYYESIFPY